MRAHLSATSEQAYGTNFASRSYFAPFGFAMRYEIHARVMTLAAATGMPELKNLARPGATPYSIAGSF